MVLITPRLVRALEPDEVPPLPTLPRRFLAPPDVEKGAPGNPPKTEKDGTGVEEPATAARHVVMVDGPAPQNEKTAAKADGNKSKVRPGSKD
jgi:hypothetical protein